MVDESVSVTVRHVPDRELGPAHAARQARFENPTIKAIGTDSASGEADALARQPTADFADQLVERLGWALADAEHEEQPIRQ